MTFGFVLLILHTLVLALGNIEVYLYGKYPGNASNLNVWFDGNEYSWVNEAERHAFNLSENNLKNEVNLCYGKRPDNAYIRGPTPWGDIYKKYGWNPVSTFIEAQKGRVLNASWEPVILLQHVFTNDREKNVMFSVGISLEIENTVSTSWSSDQVLFNGKNISYSFNIQVGERGAVSFFSYNSSCGANTNLSQTITVGSISPMELLLEPYQSVTAQLYVTQVSIKYEMEYVAHAVGQIALNYVDIYKDHHFHNLFIESCRKNANLSNQIVLREIVDIKLHADSKIVVRDNMMHDNKIMEVAL